MMDCLSCFYFSPESSSVAGRAVGVPLSYTCLFSLLYDLWLHHAADSSMQAFCRRQRERALKNRYLTPLLILYATFTEQQVSSR